MGIPDHSIEEEMLSLDRIAPLGPKHDETDLAPLPRPGERPAPRDPASELRERNRAERSDEARFADDSQRD